MIIDKDENINITEILIYFKLKLKFNLNHLPIFILYNNNNNNNNNNNKKKKKKKKTVLKIITEYSNVMVSDDRLKVRVHLIIVHCKLNLHF